MKKQAEKASKTYDMNGPMPFADIASLNGGMFDSYVHASQTFLKNTFALNQEVTRFASERIQADIEALRTLSQCKNGQDVVAFQSDFMQSAAEAYQVEISKLMEQSTEAAAALSAGVAKE